MAVNITQGEFNMTGGIVRSSVKSGDYYAINNTGSMSTNLGTANISGGLVISDYLDTMRSTASSAPINVTGGQIVCLSRDSTARPLFATNPGGLITVTGGLVLKNGNALANLNLVTLTDDAVLAVWDIPSPMPDSPYFHDDDVPDVIKLQSGAVIKWAIEDCKRT